MYANVRMQEKEKENDNARRLTSTEHKVKVYSPNTRYYERPLSNVHPCLKYVRGGEGGQMLEPDNFELVIEPMREATRSKVPAR